MAKELLGVNNNVTDALFQSTFEGILSSQWGYRGFRNRPDFVRQRIEIIPKNGSSTPAWGSLLQFSIPKRAAILRRLSARWRTAALVPDAPDDEVRFIDYAGFATMQRVTMRYGSNEIHRIEPLELYITNRLDHRRKDQEAIANLAGGDLPATGLLVDSRENRATAAQDWVVHLPFHFSELPDKNIFLEGLGYELEVDIQLPQLYDVIDVTLPIAANPTGGDISRFRLEAELIHIEDYERDFHVNRTMSDTGLFHAVREFQYQAREPVPIGQKMSYRLTNLKGACFEFRWILRDTQDVDGQLTGRKDLFNFLSFALGTNGDEYWQIRASGIEVMSPMDEKWNIFVENRDLHSGDSGDLIYGAAFGYHPEDRRNCSGHKTWAGMTNPTLEIDFGAANASATLIVDGISREYNAEHRIQGDLVKIFK